MALVSEWVVGEQLETRLSRGPMPWRELKPVLLGLDAAGVSVHSGSSCSSESLEPSPVLEAMGLGAAATKYSIFASLSNMPIYYMTRIDGWAFGKWGAGGMLNAEAVAGGIGLVLFGLTLLLVPKHRT